MPRRCHQGETARKDVVTQRLSMPETRERFHLTDLRKRSGLQLHKQRKSGRTPNRAPVPCPPALLKYHKKGSLGINTAVLSLQIRDRYRGSQSNKQERTESNNMLNKLNKRRGGFTLVEIMIVVAIIALLAAIAVPGFLRARKRSQASKILNDLRLIDAAVDQYAIETNKASGGGQ